MADLRAPPAEIAAHTADEAPHVELYLMCDDVHEEARKLKAKGVELTRPISEEAFGLVTAIALPEDRSWPLPADSPDPLLPGLALEPVAEPRGELERRFSASLPELSRLT